MDYEKLLYVALSVLLVLAITRGPALWQARRARGRTLGQLAAALGAGADIEGRYLLYFWSPSCGMCRSTTPIIEELAAERSDVLSLNVLEHMALAQEAGVMGTPAFLLVHHQQVEGLVLGTRSRKQILALLDT